MLHLKNHLIKLFGLTNSLFYTVWDCCLQKEVGGILAKYYLAIEKVRSQGDI